MNKVCYLQDSCPYFNTGDTKPPNHHVRVTVPCLEYKKGCEMAENVRIFYGEVVACDITKGKEYK